MKLVVRRKEDKFVSHAGRIQPQTVNVGQTICFQGDLVIAHALLVEIFKTSTRPTGIIAAEIFWVLGQGLLLLFAYFIPHWGKLLLVTSCPFVLVILFYR